LNAILDRQLAGAGVTEPQWVTLTIAVMNGGTIDAASLISRVADALKVSHADARARIDELAAAQLLELAEGDASMVGVTDAGSELHGRIRNAVIEITRRLWSDLPGDDLATAGRVLGIVLNRANAELARA
jgi:DNA-binding MarR family transcriptional regulator